MLYKNVSVFSGRFLIQNQCSKSAYFTFHVACEIVLYKKVSVFSNIFLIEFQRFFRIYAWEKCQELIQKNLICVIIITVSVHHWVFFNEISRNHEFLQIHFHRYLHLNIILTKTFQHFFVFIFQHTFEETLKKSHF